MWVRVQNKEILIDVKIIFINKGITKKSKGIIRASAINSVEDTILGQYESIEEAKIIFEDIQNNLVEGKRVYIMP
ncbi:hypothetical protein H7E67_02925 [Clostridium gasigenes]|uniref:hypothetical protein n=1 Tax=Clostridium gasigenes TaxID=94869 RepID=UPI0014386C31|nr:hypothetical protein [Clostridium gasigenes]MBB6622376.1 hypothetical protein [Clostridium gasigenes]MBU3109487.1 hypothetical protein [Clostridium gasigenes]NKF07326.1 hypothetical protein [Clostridium gasigenes]QSW18299.1 hypothetical protein J1C67_12110 [Clostridium gasigenes]